MAIEIDVEEAKLLARAMHAYGTSVLQSAQKLPKENDFDAERQSMNDEGARYHRRATELERQAAEQIAQAQA